MYPLYFISLNNMKKKKGNIAVILLLIMLATLLLYVSISLLTNTEKVLDTLHEDTHAADWFCISSSVNDEKMEEILENQKAVEESEKNECLFFMSAGYRKKETEKEDISFILERAKDKRNIGKIAENLVKDMKKNSILLPYYLKAEGTYEAGDMLYVTLGEEEYEFTVQGFIEDPIFASVMNVSANKCYISEDMFEEIVNDNPAAESAKAIYYKVRLKEGTESVRFDEIMTTEFNEYGMDSILVSASWTTMRGGGMMMSNIVMGILLAFSLLLIFIALIIVQFSIRQFIEENMKNIGILQASGYTGRQLKWSSILEMMLVAVFGILFGVIAGGILTVPIGNIQGGIIGLSWNQPFDLEAAIIACAVVLCMVFLISFFAGKPYGKISVLQALRGGFDTHSFRKNPLPLEKSHFSITVSLGVKNILHTKGKSLAILLIVAVLGFTVSTGFGMFQNFALDTTTLLKLTGIELGTAGAMGENLEQVGEEIEKYPEIQEVLYATNETVTITHGEKETNVTCDIWSNPEKLKNEIIVEGRLPRYENEIVLSTVIRERLNADVGDVVYVKGKGDRKEYIVCGIDQKINNMGEKTLMHFSGAKRLNGKVEPYILYVYAWEDYSFEDIEKYLKEYNGLEIINSQKQAESLLSSVSSGVTMLCIVFVSITVLVVVMVVLLLLKTRLLQERRIYGIHKALGFTTRQLMTSTMMSDLPVMIAGAIAGVGMSNVLADSITAACLSFCGIRQGNMSINPLFDILVVVGITVVAVLAELFGSLKIRKIEPVKLITEE